MPANRSDGSLIRRFRAGEEDAATALYSRYALKLQRLADRNTGSDLATRFDSDDVVQSVFRTFFRRVQGGEYDLPDGEELWRLLLVLGLNKIRKLAAYHRAQRRNVGSTQQAETSQMNLLPGLENPDLAIASLEEVIDEVTASLPPIHRQIVRLRIEGYKQSEIAATTQRTERTIERVLQTFRTRLRGLIDEATNAH
ncbi:RNA polymerase sigma factor [Posidoniimonas polymericola]|uniref:RNA polymerase sigma factor n=1 Tax=Posidoniimonas polymericola TaxID=2528002 RepID=A0A5C5XSP9_9BACT|nr:ECF-type sigma factor [Posidoniimonas polymericola]TWT66257.1 RNA polymerase sigma factor [Posidoniimonas polymericola]